MAQKTLIAGDFLQVPLDPAFNGGFSIQVSGSPVGLDLDIEGTVDGDTWFPVSVEKYADRAITTSLSTVGGAWGNAVGLKFVRAFCSALTSGVCTVTMEPKQG